MKEPNFSSIGPAAGYQSASSAASPPPPRLDLNLSRVASKLMRYVPVDVARADTGELVQSYLDQISRMQPVTSLLSATLPALGLNDTVIQPQAIQMKLLAWFEDSKVDGSSFAATVDTLAQLAQGVVDFQPRMRAISASLLNVTTVLRSQIDPIFRTLSGSNSSSSGGAGGRRMLQQVDTQALIRQLVQTALASPGAAPLVAELSRWYSPSALPDLAASLYGVLLRLAAAGGDLRDLMDRLDTHLDVSLLPSFPIYNPRTGANLSFLADPVPYDKRTTIVLPVEARRQLAEVNPLAAAMLLPRPPPEFRPAAAATQPRALIPLVFHVLTYSVPGGSFGPPNWQRVPEYVARIVALVNAMARPANLAFFVNEVRHNPTA
ncbi:hypothetical protein GPECTOR_3g118 [Gonium pectorale]|uniref:Uncharacterized protein n=1 Tax=Gonium pectorale TaxID=33097 RepID=A0A150GYM5_GONPE|nr:hypothetical protein GPECTOR_3g118 [Gonium pectorale]|eukprot:KXZ54949.1 hypothetical protein GPECTOR_3g118 [Gonium pectorale]